MVFKALSAEELRQRIIALVRSASTEITTRDVKLLQDLREVLHPSTKVYVAHTPEIDFLDVVDAAISVRRSGFAPVPHIVARRLNDSTTLRQGLRRLVDEGVEDVFLVAGDTPHPYGEFADTLGILQAQILENSGIRSVGVAGHPEGHKAVESAHLWNALKVKQAFAASHGLEMRVVSQFTFSPRAVHEWVSSMPTHGIRLPVHVGIAGPTSVPKLINYAMRCGVGASLNTLRRMIGASKALTDLAVEPATHLVALASSDSTPLIHSPHFFSLGSPLKTARWMRKIADGHFDVFSEDSVMRIRELSTDHVY